MRITVKELIAKHKDHKQPRLKTLAEIREMQKHNAMQASLAQYDRLKALL